MRDWVVIGSGFGGSVASLRLVEKGYDVVCLERGRRFEDADFARRRTDVHKLLWLPRLGLRGIMALTPLRHVAVLSGVGVGGGSLVYGNTLYVPESDEFYEHPQWGDLADWRAALAPHFATAQRMLGVTTYEGHGPSEEVLDRIAADLGVGDSVHPTRVGVFFGEPGETVADPYFDGEGPPRTGCIRCGRCMLGCPHGAKNTLVKNYLHLAERRGLRIAPRRTVVDVRPLGAADGSDGYAVTSVRSGAWLRHDRRTIHTRGVVVAAGALGTSRLLLRCRQAGSLPRLSDRVGHLVRTNSEAIVAATATDATADVRGDIAITRSVHPDGQTHFTNNGYGELGDLLALQFGPLTGGRWRPLQFVAKVLARPLRWLSPTRLRDWSRRSIIFTVMQSLDSSLRLERGRFGRLTTRLPDGGEAPSSHLPIANLVAERAAHHLDGYPSNSVTESLLGTPTTAHVLGGAVIGDSPATGVVDRRRRVFGYRNLLVTDGATMPANVGVNPSLTITAMAEEALSFVPTSDEARANPGVD